MHVPELDALQTVLVALVLLLIGRWLVLRIAVLARYNIPVPVVGGLLFSLAIAAMHETIGFEAAFDTSFQAPLMIAFFSTIGLGADLKLLALGGPRVLLFLVVAVAFLVVQNTVGLAGALALDLPPAIGLLTGSITLSGGHGTGVAYASRLIDGRNLQGALELAMASATFGLVIGGIIGGPLAARLIARHKLKSGASSEGEEKRSVSADTDSRITLERTLESLLLTVVCLVAGGFLERLVGSDAFTLPAFLWSLLVGIVIRNACEMGGFYRPHTESVSLIGNLSLSLFLAMALMQLRLWELVALAGPLFALLALHTAAMVGFAYFITFRVMGRSYDAAIISAGHCGFGMGATPTAVANMQAITGRHGASPQAFLVIPMVGAFFIDIANALVLQGFFSLPLFGF